MNPSVQTIQMFRTDSWKPSLNAQGARINIRFVDRRP